MKTGHHSLAICGLVLICAILPARQASAQLCLRLNGGTSTQDFNALAVSGASNSIIRIGFAFLETGSGGNITYAASDGSSNTANTYSYGTGTNTDRALGELTDATVQSTIGGCMVNNTGVPLNSFTISYTGEEWRLGASDINADRLDFQYSLNATSLNDGTWFNVDSLDFVTPNNTLPNGAKDGNDSLNRTVFPPTTINICGIGIPNGGVIYFRWLPTDISGSDDGLAIDDFSVTVATPCPGDANLDHEVNVNDLLQVITHWGTCP